VCSGGPIQNVVGVWYGGQESRLEVEISGEVFGEGGGGGSAALRGRELSDLWGRAQDRAKGSSGTGGKGRAASKNIRLPNGVHLLYPVKRLEEYVRRNSRRNSGNCGSGQAYRQVTRRRGGGGEEGGCSDSVLGVKPCSDREYTTAGSRSLGGMRTRGHRAGWYIATRYKRFCACHSALLDEAWRMECAVYWDSWGAL